MPNPIARNPSIPMRLILATTLLAFATPPALGQPPNPPALQTAAGGKLSFEVASIRPSVPNAPYSSNVSLDSSDYLVGYNGGLVKMDGLLIHYIIFAYKVQNVSQYQLVYDQLPKWSQTERFIVEARPAGSPTKDQIRLMMQSLLTDRFKLVIHTETRQLPMYALMLDKPGKPGPRLQSHPDDGLCTKMPDKSTPPAKNSLPPSCSLIVFTDNPQLPHMRMMDYTMEQIAGGLETVGATTTGGLDHIPIVDRTGLTGKFDIDLEFLRQPRPGQQPAPESQPEDPGPSFIEALKTQAGLRLVKQAGPVEVYVIDHVGPPTEN